MAEPTTFIKLDRNILRWGWYQDANTMRVFLHLLLTANIKEGVYKGVTIGRGEVVTTYPKLCEDLKISIQQARNSLNHLQATGEATVRRYPKFSVVSIVSYDKYQAKQQPCQQRSNSIATPKSTPKQQPIPIKEYKKKRREEAATPQFSPTGDLKVKGGEVDEYGFRWG